MYDTGKTDKVTTTLFKYGKLASSFLAVACLIAFVIGLFQYLGAGPSRLQAPDFSDFKPYLGLSESTEVERNFSRVDTKIAVEKKYDAHINKIIKDNELNEGSYALFVGWLAETPPNRRSRFINGLDDFLDDFSDWLEENSTDDLTNERRRNMTMNVAKKYNIIFEELVEKEVDRYQRSYQERTNIVLFLACTLIFFVLFLIVPLLIRIEENTRFFK